MKSPFHLPSFIALALPVAGIWLTSGDPTRNAETTGERQAGTRTKSTEVRPEALSPKILTTDGVVMIRPDEWEARFQTQYQDVDPEIRSEVVQLAGELEDFIAKGLDPKGEEAQTFGETILTLLDEKTARE